MQQLHFEQGEPIIRQGEPGDSAYRILSGQVEVFYAQGGERKVLARLGAGEIFGEMGMIEDKPRSASVMAIEPTDVETITPQEFNELFSKNPSQLFPYLRSFFERLRRANERMVAVPCPAPSLHKPILESVTISTGGPASPEPGTVRLLPKTDLLLKKLGRKEIVIRKFPYRIGRWSETADVFVANDLLLRDEAPHLVSRNHCAIEREGEGYCVHDRGSAGGTFVNGRQIGGLEMRMKEALRRGENEIRLGGFESPYAFQVFA